MNDVLYDSKTKKIKKRRSRSKEDVNIVKELLSLIIYIGIVIVFCFLIITFVGQRTNVHGASMENTINDKDNLWVDKLIYKIKDPERFDIIVFPYQGSDVFYIKRIIGLPGETVRIDTNGNIYINEELLIEDYGKEIIQPDKLGIASSSITLASDEYFVLGDNRNNSKDSRWSDVGNIKKEEIIGKAVFRLTPFSGFGFLD